MQILFLMLFLTQSAHSMDLAEFNPTQAAQDFKEAPNKEKFLTSINYIKLDSKQKDDFVGALDKDLKNKLQAQKSIIDSLRNSVLLINSIMVSFKFFDNALHWNEHSCYQSRNPVNLTPWDYSDPKITPCSSIQIDIALSSSLAVYALFCYALNHHHNKRTKSTHMYQLLSDLHQKQEKKDS